MRLVQLALGPRRAAGLAEGASVRLLRASSVYEIAWQAALSGQPLAQTVHSLLTSELIDPESGLCRWLPCIDHPEPARCLVSGAGLTHESSARNR